MYSIYKNALSVKIVIVKAFYSKLGGEYFIKEWIFIEIFTAKIIGV